MTKVSGIQVFMVLAACVDIRSGKRFDTGDVFDPPPTTDQARRLVAAGCLPAEAIESARDLESEDHTASAKAEADAKAAEEKAAADAKAKAEAGKKPGSQQ